MDDEDKYFNYYLVFMSFCIFITMSFFCGGGCQEDRYRKLAIENKAAEWTINKETGEKKFEWIKENKWKKGKI